MSLFRPRGRRTHSRLPAAADASAGPGLVLDGEPTVETHQGGRIAIGARFALSSLPVQSHMVSLGTLSVGDDVSIAHGAAIAAFRSVSIGNRTRIGPFFILMDTDFHGERARVGYKANNNTAIGADSGYAPVTIGADVRIGPHVTVLRGSVIGDGATIAAGSVVNGRIPAGAFAAGVPARVVDRSAPSTLDAESADVGSVMMTVFGLSGPPEPASGPDDIPGWDSLGSLKLLLALEEAFGCAIDEDALAGARTVADVQHVVDSVRQRATLHAAG